jgi:hypothetical protein
MISSTAVGGAAQKYIKVTMNKVVKKHIISLASIFHWN